MLASGLLRGRSGVSLGERRARVGSAGRDASERLPRGGCVEDVAGHQGGGRVLGLCGEP